MSTFWHNIDTKSIMSNLLDSTGGLKMDSSSVIWEIVNVTNTAAPANTAENADSFKKWKQRNVKAEFVLKRSISHGFFDHIMQCKSPHEIWEILDQLFNKMDEAQLQNKAPKNTLSS
ncbi:hypothetical protein RJ641_016537 [Dillenia turbinata]|uniref:Uncharacterized protein n=1 Tax=Dillenia turbinata TaxID=194707 RepID=A0AAN8UM44_9MAGN